jgi:hypothetical protein
MRTTFIAFIFFLSGFTASLAAPLDIQVQTPDGQPVANAVVRIGAPAKALPAGFDFPWPLQMAQRDLEFDPFVLIVPAGSEVAFPNFDNVKHHVYSFSPIRKFEIKLYGRKQTHAVSFPVPGVAAIGCNIHDGMSAYIYVADTPFAVKTDAAGAARFPDAPDGALSLEVWHPDAGAPNLLTPVAVAAGARGRPVLVTLSLRAKRRSGHGYR